MITFHKISYRNFLSTGNQPNEIHLNKYGSTLITGKNGDGKSTMLCALTFGLFGKPFRNVNKNQLINSINRKNCLVEIEFSVGGKVYNVRRGIKPTVFEIFCDGELINQDAALRDYQKVLEQQILKLNFKTFTQVVILGSATFVPFMQLPATQRREIIEDILDIKVFSTMNQILKDKAAQTKAEIALIDQEIAQQKIRVTAQSSLIEILEKSRQAVVDNIQSKLDANNKQIVTSHEQVEQLIADMIELQKQDNSDTLKSALDRANKMKVKYTTKIDDCKHSAQFFIDNTSCNVCSQTIAESHKQSILNDLNLEIMKHKSTLEELERVLEKLDIQLEQSNQLINKIREKSIEITALNSSITILNKQNKELVDEMNSASTDTSNLAVEKETMKQLAADAMKLVESKSLMLVDREVHEIAGLLLKDTGIKTAIIKEYLPVVNKLINKYLAAMDLFVKFNLDDSFQETIQSRGRDEFTYESFSEGEKRRLDLAILFTWRQVAKMKNSVNTNIMILDEILDGALDSAGIEYFLSIMNQFGENTNVFVISHKVHQMIERFDHVIRVEKKNDFSIMSQGG